MRYHQLTSEERYRNSRRDGGYRPFTAGEMTRGRRGRSRRNWRFGEQEWALVRSRLELYWSPEQIAGRLDRDKLLAISHETIYRYIWYDKHSGSYTCSCAAPESRSGSAIAAMTVGAA